MKIGETLKNYLTKLQRLSDRNKKIVLWTIVGILGLTMGYFWIRGAVDTISKIGSEVGQIKLPEIQIPATDILQTTTPSNK